MLPSIAEIKILRKRLSLTQEGLSKASGVSQSLIAKTESGRIVPSYDKARRLFEALESASKRESLHAKDIMSKKFKSVRESDTARKAIGLMEKNGFSQAPVIMKGKCTGVVTESGILASLRELGGKKFNSVKVREIMEEPPPILSEDTAFAVLAGVLRHEQAVLISRKGKITGIVTKSDLLKSALIRV